MIDVLEIAEPRPRSRWLERLIEAERAERLAEEPAEHTRYLLILVDPTIAKPLGQTTEDIGLQLYVDLLFSGYVRCVPSAVEQVSDECGYPVTTVQERDGDLWCWTFQPVTESEED